MKAPTTPPFSRILRVDDARRGEARFPFEADVAERAALAKLNGLVAIETFAGEVEATPRPGGRISLRGRALAKVVQTCVVSLDEFAAEVVCPIEADFVEARPTDAARQPRGGRTREIDVDPVEDAPDEILDGRIDVGALAAEALSLALDPYPRKPGVAFVAPPET
ncbi:MAG: DUF177 domain-containing protein [Hyphomicrobiales bacterium]|nr:DUF177 domain-containing protein [Hyphomicrobiales bacterium]